MVEEFTSTSDDADILFCQRITCPHYSRLHATDQANDHQNQRWYPNPEPNTKCNPIATLLTLILDSDDGEFRCDRYSGCGHTAVRPSYGGRNFGGIFDNCEGEKAC